MQFKFQIQWMLNIWNQIIVIKISNWDIWQLKKYLKKSVLILNSQLLKKIISIKWSSLCFNNFDLYFNFCIYLLN